MRSLNFTRRHTGKRGTARLGWLLALAGILLATGVTVLDRWATPPGWLHPARDAFDQAKKHWPSATAITTAAAVAGVLVPLLLWWLDRHRRGQTVEQARQDQQRLVMLQRVRYKWISGVLEPSLAHAARLALGLERRPDTLDLSVRVLYWPGGPPQPLAAGTQISQVFDQVGGGLLILGAPGAGKTTLLLELARGLLDRAKRDSMLAIPVVVNLASWARERKPLPAWLVDELADGYQVPRQIAGAWVGQDALALLLDGLDEVADAHRAACVEAINAYRGEHGLVPLVVCSRTAEMQTLGARLRLEEAVELQPPSDTQVDDYLGYLEATGTPLTDVRAALRTDQTLRELLHSPLLLHVLAMAYHGEPAPALQAPGTLAQRQARLWEAYVARMFKQHPLDPGGYTPQRAVGWLAWLAGKLRERDQSEFHLDRLDLDWLPTEPTQTRLASVGVAVGLLAASVVWVLAAGVGLIVGLPVGLAHGPWWGFAVGVGSVWLIGLIVERIAGQAPIEELHWSHNELVVGLVGGLLGGLGSHDPVSGPGVEDPSGLAESLFFGLLVGLFFGLLGGVVGWLVGRQPVRELHLSRGPLVLLALGLVLGLLSGLQLVYSVGLVLWLLAWLVFWLADRPTRGIAQGWKLHLSRGGLVGLAGGLLFGLVSGSRAGLVGGLAFGLAFGLGFWLIFGMVGGMRDKRITPNEGTRRSAKHALGFGLPVAFAFGLVSGLDVGLGLGLLVGLALGGAAWLRHYAVRAGLASVRAAPWRYGSFLDAMADRLLLRRSGSAYLFVHRLLRDYLADLNPDRPAAT